MKTIILLGAVAAILNSAASANENIANHQIVTIYEASNTRNYQVSNETANRLALIGRLLKIKSTLARSNEFLLNKISANAAPADNGAYRIVMGKAVTMTSEGEVKHLHLKYILDDDEIKAYFEALGHSSNKKACDVLPKAWGPYEEFSLYHVPGDAFENTIGYPKQKLMLVKEEM